MHLKHVNINAFFFNGRRRCSNAPCHKTRPKSSGPSLGRCDRGQDVTSADFGLRETAVAQHMETGLAGVQLAQDPCLQKLLRPGQVARRRLCALSKHPNLARSKADKPRACDSVRAEERNPKRKCEVLEGSDSEDLVDTPVTPPPPGNVEP